MDIEALKAFRLVVELGSISVAAEKLNYSQSNITMKIHKLEEQLQTKLLYRHNRGCSATPKGEELYHYAIQIFKTMELAENAMQNQENPTGSLLIGSMETTAAIHLPSILSNYCTMYPNVTLNLKTNPTAILIEKVLNYELDGAFISGPIQHSLLQSKTVFLEEMVLIYRGSTKDISIENTNILVFRAGCSYRFQLEKYLRHQKIKSYRIMELGSLEAILGCVAAGLGITLLPRSVYERYIRYYQLQCVAVPKEFSFIETQFISHIDNPSISLSHFEKMIKDQMRTTKNGGERQRSI